MEVVLVTAGRAVRLAGKRDFPQRKTERGLVQARQADSCSDAEFRLITALNNEGCDIILPQIQAIPLRAGLGRP